MRHGRKLRVAIAMLSLLGMAIAAYLTIVDFMGATPACAAGASASCSRPSTCSRTAACSTT